MTSKPTRRPFRLEGLAFGEWRLQSTFATREAAVNWLRDRPTRIIDTRTGQDVTTESEPTDDADARALAAEVASRGYREDRLRAERDALAAQIARVRDVAQAGDGLVWMQASELRAALDGDGGE